MFESVNAQTHRPYKYNCIKYLLDMGGGTYIKINNGHDQCHCFRYIDSTTTLIS